MKSASEAIAKLSTALLHQPVKVPELKGDDPSDYSRHSLGSLKLFGNREEPVALDLVRLNGAADTITVHGDNRPLILRVDLLKKASSDEIMRSLRSIPINIEIRALLDEHQPIDRHQLDRLISVMLSPEISAHNFSFRKFGQYLKGIDHPAADRVLAKHFIDEYWNQIIVYNSLYFATYALQEMDRVNLQAPDDVLYDAFQRIAIEDENTFGKLCMLTHVIGHCSDEIAELFVDTLSDYLDSLETSHGIMSAGVLEIIAEFEERYGFSPIREERQELVGNAQTHWAAWEEKRQARTISGSASPAYRQRKAEAFLEEAVATLSALEPGTNVTQLDQLQPGNWIRLHYADGKTEDAQIKSAPQMHSFGIRDLWTVKLVRYPIVSWEGRTFTIGLESFGVVPDRHGNVRSGHWIELIDGADAVDPDF